MENNNFEQQNNQQFTDNNANPQQPQFYGPPPALDKKSTGLNILFIFHSACRFNSLSYTEGSDTY